MIIGTFTTNKEGSYTGNIHTPALHLEGVVFEKQSKGADFTLSAEFGDHVYEIGAAWKKTGDFGDYLSVRLDSPVFLAPINATMKLKASDTGFFGLRWARRKEEE